MTVEQNSPSSPYFLGRREAYKVGVSVCRLPHAQDLALPAYGSAGAAGVDFMAALPVGETLSIASGERALVPTGLCIALPQGYELQLRPRSGLALKHGLTLPNTPGTIDEDYRGEIKIIIMNMGRDNFIINRGMRIAQGVLAPVTRIVWQECAMLEETERGHKGFGSTGIGEDSAP